MGQQELKLAGRSSEKPRKRKWTEASDVFHVQKAPTPADKSSRREWAHACLPGLSQANNLGTSGEGLNPSVVSKLI